MNVDVHPLRRQDLGVFVSDHGIDMEIEFVADEVAALSSAGLRGSSFAATGVLVSRKATISSTVIDSPDDQARSNAAVSAARVAATAVS